ncbi:FkbM family methyltransferase [Variovorax sp. J22R115]|uniref:FkbM family methyltransferase n=1 Tax=Variovorax sp. J22R115 TaxID=3053509 RepID=UPI002576CCD9|nr:FkbM family methyltransferase [Variovorax sp. J22R115]MDM0049020.1 FkbM family methyltransferase [Variovorax sp. J22R115]
MAESITRISDTLSRMAATAEVSSQVLIDQMSAVAAESAAANQILADRGGGLGYSQIEASRNQVDIYERMTLRLLLDHTSIVDRCVIVEGAWEQSQIKFFIGLVKTAVRRRDIVFLDIGSYWGLYSLLAMRAGVRRIHAFDADRHNFAQLQAQIFLNDAAGTINPHNLAVSAEAGNLRCWDSRTHPDGNRGGVGIVGRDAKDQPSYEVVAVAIDDFLPFEREVIFIKIDVEGHEDKALLGLRQTIEGNKVVIQVEIFEAQWERVMPIIEEFGLRRIHQITPDYYYTNMTNDELELQSMAPIAA